MFVTGSPNHRTTRQPQLEQDSISIHGDMNCIRGLDPVGMGCGCRWRWRWGGTAGGLGEGGVPYCRSSVSLQIEARGSSVIPGKGKKMDRGRAAPAREEGGFGEGGAGGERKWNG